MLDFKRTFQYNRRVLFSLTGGGAADMVTTFRPKTKQRKREHGFRKRMATANGRKVLSRRRNKGRKVLTA